MVHFNQFNMCLPKKNVTVRLFFPFKQKRTQTSGATKTPSSAQLDPERPPRS